MAFTDILLSSDDNEEFILEFPVSTLNSPNDILQGDNNSDIFVMEISKEATEVFTPFVF